MGEERILIIIPAYNEAENIEHVVDDLVVKLSAI
jgi:glycosyltransferase involved in cell wall biosynthesis